MTMDPLPPVDHPVWFWKANADPFDLNQPEQWTLYPRNISDMIEAAYQHGFREIAINDEYRIDFAHKLQIRTGDSSRQRPVRRQSGATGGPTQTELESESDLWRHERFDSPLGPALSLSATVDTPYQGSPFIIEWLVSFTSGTLKVKFNHIFGSLVEGIEKEGQQQLDPCTKEIIDFLQRVKNQNKKARNSKRMKTLQEACAKLYTKDCFLYRLVNQTLRDNDRSKLTTLGPYCYLVYNYIGSRLTDCLSIRNLLRQQIHPIESRQMVVYRGDHATREMIEEYSQAAGKKDKYFKWLPFVSTSRKIDIAKRFGRNTLYVIDLHRYVSNDQFASLEEISFCKIEKEILLRPGVRFLVDQVKLDEIPGRTSVYINIVPSYVFNLR